MSAPLHVIVLAAGEGKRMKSTVTKVLQKILVDGTPIGEAVAAGQKEMEAIAAKG